MDTIAVQSVLVDYEGRAAHAAAAPWEGRNTLDAAVLGYMNIASLRQHIRPTERVHGVITQGGEKANIVPRVAQALDGAQRHDRDAGAPEGSASWRASTAPHRRAAVRCRRAGTATRCADIRDNGPIAAAYVRNAAATGRTVVDPATISHRVVGSTDMGNVSYLTPAIHPMIQVHAERGCHPHRRLRPVHTERIGRSRRAGWCPRPRHDRDRPVVRRDPANAGSRGVRHDHRSTRCCPEQHPDSGPAGGLGLTLVTVYVPRGFQPRGVRRPFFGDTSRTWILQCSRS